MKYVLFFFIIFFASFSDLFLYRIGIIPYKPADFLIPVFFVICIVTFKLTSYLKYLKTNTFKFLLAFFILSVLFGLNKTVDYEVIKTSVGNHFISLLTYSFCLILFAKSSIKETRLFLLIGCIVISLSIWYDMFIGLPIEDVDLMEQARKGGFGENPNVGASAVKFLGFGLLLLYKDVKIMRTILLILVFSSVFLTFSRSGLLATLMFIILLLFNDWKSYFNIKVSRLIITGIKSILVLGLLYALLLTFADIVRKEVPAFRQGAAAERLDLLTGQSKGGVISEDDQSNFGRKTLVKNYLDEFYSHPLGQGTGFCADKSINYKNTHNFYLRTAVEYGILGLIILIIFLYRSINLSFSKDNYYYLVFMLMILFEFFISHYLFQEKPILIVLALMDANLYFKNAENEEASNEKLA